MRRSKRFTLLVVVAAAMLLLAGCTKSVVGTYSNDFFGYSLTLNEDLTGRYKQGEYVVNGTYTVEDGTIIFRYKYND